MKNVVSGLALVLMLASPSAMAKEKVAVPEPSTKPDWTAARIQAEAIIRGRLFDPEAARINWTRGFFWTSYKHSEVGIVGKRRWGWVACGEFNGKNRMGGYVGAKEFAFAITEEGTIRDEIDSDCSYETRRYGELVPELQDAGNSGITATTSVGLADELAKLAKLRTSGILSEAEFEAQKAKLLSR